MTAATKVNITSSVHTAPVRWLQIRYVVAFATSMVNAIFYMLRINLSVAIIAIALEDSENDSRDAPHYDWSSTERSTILSSFFWGYTVMQIPAMMLVNKFGPKRIVFTMAILSAATTILFVPLAGLGWEWACASRTLLGVSQSGLMVSVHQLLARWSPINERSRMVVYAYSGQQLGTVAALAGSGVLSDWAGWPWVFYVSGALSLLLAVVWIFIVEDSPAQHRLVSPQELALIENSIHAAKKEEKHHNLQTPWIAIFTSLPFCSLLISQCAQAWGYWTLLTGIPSYMNGVLDFNLSEDGLLSSLPYIAMWVMSISLGWLPGKYKDKIFTRVSDILLKRGLWSVGTSRKIGNSLGLYGSAIALVVLSYTGNDPVGAVIILVVAVGLNSGCTVGNTPNYIDLSPNFVAALAGLANEASCFMGLVGPLLIGFVVVDNESASQWRIVFLITAGIYIVGNTVFIIFGSGKEQPWNNPETLKSSKDAMLTQNLQEIK